MSSAQNVVNSNGSPAVSPGPASPPVAMYPSPGPGTVIYMPAMPVPTPHQDFCENYRHRQSIGLGAFQVIVGILCIIFNAVGLGFSWQFAGGLYIGHGFWSGVLFIITGALGISAGQTKARCKIIGFMTTCILSACCAAPLLAISIIGAVSVTPRVYNCNPYSVYYQYYYSSCQDMDGYRVVVAMQSLMAILAITEAILAIWGSAISCQAVCCCTPVTTQGVIVPANYLPSNGQVMYINQSQGAPYVYSQPASYTNGQAAAAVGPPSYQASYAQAAWGMQPHQQTPLYYPSAPNYDGSEHHPYPGNPQSPQSAADPPKY